MATDERRRRRDTGRALADELTALQRSYLMAQVEGVATLADAARDFLNRIADEEPLSNAATWGDAIRDTPDTVIDATLDASTRLSEIPKRMAETFRSELKSDRPARTRSAGRRAGSTPEHEIVAEARAHLRGIPGAAALLGGLVDNVSLRTGFERETVRTVILRHFVSNGTVVRDRPAPGGEEEAGDPALARMERTLTVLGYTDLRRDCALAAFPGLDETAALVAYSGRPVILCYPTDTAGVEDPGVREAARVQAASLDESGGARYVWVSDGDRDYYFDAEQDRALATLPPAGAVL